MIEPHDRALLAHLQQDGRLTNAELAERIGLSLSACHRRVKRLEGAGVIVGYQAIVDRKQAGFSVLAYVWVTLEKHSEDLLDAFLNGVEEVREIVACHAVAGGADYLLLVVAEDMDAYAAVALQKIVRLPGVKNSSSNFVLTTYKQMAGWPL
jgi:DNA-binding Lrp family transcriptional regulator